MNARLQFESVQIPRSAWLRCWSAISPALIKACATRICEQAQVLDLRHPRGGLALMQMRDSALGQCFFVGELPWCRSHVRVQFADGRAGEGAVEWMDDRADVARALAILDAVLSSGLPGSQEAYALLIEGSLVVEQVDAQRRLLLDCTRVDFQRLDEHDE